MQLRSGAELVTEAGADCRGGLCFDEMKIKQGLVFCCMTDELVGYTDLCAASEAQLLKELLDSCEADDGAEATRTLATHILMFYWTSLGKIPLRYDCCALPLANRALDAGVRLHVVRCCVDIKLRYLLTFNLSYLPSCSAGIRLPSPSRAV